jgi:hypothetical protein
VIETVGLSVLTVFGGTYLVILRSSDEDYLRAQTERHRLRLEELRTRQEMRAADQLHDRMLLSGSDTMGDDEREDRT